MDDFWFYTKLSDSKEKKNKNKQTKKQSALICQVLSPDDVIHFQHFVFTKQQSPLQV